LGMLRVHHRALCAVMFSGVFALSCCAQDLAPRAYIITPLRSNAIIVTNSFFHGSIDYNGVVPISDASGTYNIPSLSYYHSFGVFGHSANVVAALPYGVGNFRGTVGSDMQVYRSGFVDSVYRVAVNLKGGPAMPVEKFMTWKEKRLIGVSLKVIAPTGQYDATKLVNWGTHRWSFKPEFGYSQAWNKWVLDAYSGMWFFTTNPEFYSRNATYPGTRSQSQQPMVEFEGHISYDVKPRLWVSLDGNFWVGGKTSLNGVENSLTRQANSRIGATISVPASKHGSLKVSYSNGLFIEYGGNYQSVSVAWQYSWLGRPD
jgi:hypothetical protein